MMGDRNQKRVVVFDMDETLGYFTDLGVLWDCLNITSSLDNDHFFEIVDLFSIYLRPQIMNILKFIKKMKQKNKCHKVMIYTNNQGPKSWTQLITGYFENKLDYNLFDQLILSFKLDGKRVELNRTSHNKSVKDFFKCTDLPTNVHICFLDDKYHPEMDDEQVYYVHMKPYHYSIEYRELADSYYDKFHNQFQLGEKSEFVDSLVNCMKQFGFNKHHTTKEELAVDEVIGKQIMICIKDFFDEHGNTRRHRPKKDKSFKNKTRRR